ncbi:hypothetical protein ACFVZJ_21145 [Streptomyces sp. NPDC058322]|uniref:hypothetical protein n=1 Tax=Streptomyces sp. NPDC058322 TaxID=3346446 RepID=UPI0036E56F11
MSIIPSAAPNNASPARDELREYADRYGYTGHVNGLLDAFRAEVLREAAAEIGDACPDHSEADTCYIDCQCAAARDLRRMADEAATGGAS